MTLPADLAEAAPRRHRLVFVDPERWRRLLAVRDDLGAEPLLADWVNRGWPLVARRPGAGEGHGLALGLPLPPSHGKRRIAVLMRRDDVVAILPPPLLDDARAAAPASWIDSLDRVSALAAQHGGPARVFGSLAWQWLTDLPYLSAGSDLDLLLPCAAATAIGAQTGGLAAIEAAAPMRIDGELERPDGAAVNWREMHAGMDEVLVKTATGVAMVRCAVFLGGPPV